eukprot:scaffold2960_cov273-Prasinococcus_capsulatus_cf.AAC.2
MMLLLARALTLGQTERAGCGYSCVLLSALTCSPCRGWLGGVCSCVRWGAVGAVVLSGCVG